MQISEGEVVPCVIEKILDSGVIVKIYETNIEGFIHVSELSKTWINKPEEAVKVGQILPAKVLNTSGQIELSIKRVSDEDRREILKEISIIRKLELILQKDPKGEELIKSIRENYGSLYYLFQNYSKLKDKFDLSEETRKEIEALIEKHKKKIKIKYKMIIRSFDPEGVEKIKEFLSNIAKNSEGVKIFYQKAPEYIAEISEEDAKQTIKYAKKFEEFVKDEAKKSKIELELQRYEED